MTVMQYLPCHALQSLKDSSQGCSVVHQAPFGRGVSFITSRDAMETLGRFTRERQCQGIAQLCIHRYVLNRTIIALSENTETLLAFIQRNCF